MSNKSKMAGNLRLILINYGVFVTILFTLECLGQLGYFILKNRFLWEDKSKEGLFKEHPYLVGVPKNDFRIEGRGLEGKTVRITTDSMGFRSTGKAFYNKKAINIVCLGGSTTFCTGVSDQDSWPYKLQKRLGSDFNVYNLGVPGYSTTEAIIQLGLIVSELNPDIIIAYQGWNDIRRYHVRPQSPDNYSHGLSQKTNLQVEKQKLWNYFFLTRLSDVIRSKFLPVQVALSKPQVIEGNDPYVDSIYVRNLKTIKTLCEHLNAKSIFIPQVINNEALMNTIDETYVWTPHIRNKDMPYLMENFNSLMQTKIQPDMNCVVIKDAVKSFDWKTRHFIDFCHLSAEGCDRFSEIVAKAVTKFSEEVNQ